MAFIKCFCSMSTEIWLLSSLTVRRPKFFFSWVSSLWPATIPIFYAYGPRLKVIEDPCNMYLCTADM